MSEALRQVVWKCDRCGGDAQAIFGIFPSCKCGSTSFKAAQPPAPTAQPAPVNGIKATMFHDEGAIAQCQGCKRYSLDPNTLHQSDSKQPVCECGKQHYWSGSFVKPGPDAKWHGKAPAAQPVQQPGAEPMQGGMDNAELLAAWKKKLPSVEPSDAQLTAFAVGVEVGFSHARDLERQDWSRVHHALAKHGVHPGRTDDHLADVIDRALAAPAQRQPLTVPALTDAQMSECAWGYVADSRNLDAGVTGIIQATQLACAAAWGITLAAQKGEKL